MSILGKSQASLLILLPSQNWIVTLTERTELGPYAKLCKTPENLGRGGKKSAFYTLKNCYTLLTWHLFQSTFKDSYVCKVVG